MVLRKKIKATCDGFIQCCHLESDGDCHHFPNSITRGMPNLVSVHACLVWFHLGMIFHLRMVVKTMDDVVCFAMCVRKNSTQKRWQSIRCPEGVKVTISYLRTQKFVMSPVILSLCQLSFHKKRWRILFIEDFSCPYVTSPTWIRYLPSESGENGFGLTRKRAWPPPPARVARH